MKYRALKNEYGLYPMVKCQLHRVGHYWSASFDALIDTGSAATIIPARIARAGNLLFKGTIALHSHVVSGSCVEGRQAVGAIKILADSEFDLRATFVVIQDMKDFAILGNDLLRKCRVELGTDGFSIAKGGG